MNSDINYNGRVANEASIQKGKICKEVRELCDKLGIDAPEPKLQTALSETNSWLATLAVKLEAINAAVVAAKAVPLTPTH